MRKTLAASALGAVIVLGGPQLAHADTPTPTPSSTATVTETQHTTTTVTEHDKTGLWGLLGLLGLAGLAGLRKPRHTEYREHVGRHEATTIRPAQPTDARRVDDVRTEPGVRDVRTGELRTEADDVRTNVTNTTNDVRRDV